MSRMTKKQRMMSPFHPASGRRRQTADESRAAERQSKIRRKGRVQATRMQNFEQSIDRAMANKENR